MTAKGKNLKQHMEEIDKILAWFEASETLDVEEALKKVKQAAELIKAGKERLEKVENEFQEIKREIGEE